MVTKYNKLVRDKIPSIIEESGKTCNTLKIDECNMMTHLLTKLNEEFHELLEAANNNDNAGMLEELVDIKTVINAIIPRISSFDHFDMVETVKNYDSGEFFDNVLLVDVTEDS